MAESDSPKIWASVGTTINTGNYENYKIDIGVTGVPIDATPEQTAKYLEMTRMKLFEVVASLGEQLIMQEHAIREGLKG